MKRGIARAGTARIGTSGYQYDSWRGVLYPEDLPKSRWLERYAQVFDTVEINNTFYRLPSEEVFASWRSKAPRGFVFAVKMSRFASHMKHLRDPEQTIARLLERARALGPALGPILVQLPPRWHADPERLEAFLRAAPKRHRWAVEVRHPSWLAGAVYEVLHRHGAALVIHDLLPSHPRVVTAGWVYTRFHGAGGGPRYAGTYSDAQLANEARWMDAQLRAGRDAYAYFNNDVGGHAVRDALRLRGALAELRGARRAA
ncbi:MAG: DUF72 domain-containing protein [Sandaracinaceae bacterium]|nr:DUF72 domain-containing protein [Sandaracinaceae bacterium]